MAFRVFGSAHTSVAQASALGTIYPLTLLSEKKEGSHGHGSSSPEESQDPNSVVTEKQKTLEQSKRRRVPLIASVAVSCRVELFHDLLSAQITATSGKACSDTIFANDSDWRVPTDTGGGDRSSMFRASEYVFTPNEDILLLELICHLLLSLGTEIERISKSRRESQTTLQTVRQNLRFHVFQYLLGLDERWNFNQTVTICQMILEFIEKYRPLLWVDEKNPFLNSMQHHLPFTFIGKRSQLLTPSTLNILARGLPKTLFGLKCSVRYSLQDHGASVMTLLNLSERKSYSGCLLVIEDTAGYIFGGYLDGQIRDHMKQYFGNGACFVFRALPNTKIYSWSKK
jgi:hypothetical protein